MTTSRSESTAHGPRSREEARRWACRELCGMARRLRRRAAMLDGDALRAARLTRTASRLERLAR